MSAGNEEQLILLEIITPTTVEAVSVRWIELETPNGVFMVGPDHAPLISMIKKKGVVTLEFTAGRQQRLNAPGGIFKISNNQATLLLSGGE